MLITGIVGMPNVGKSTLFNALTKTRKAEAANYPFCTIEPNMGIVQIPDSRLDLVSSLSKAKKTVPTAIEFVDIAGLVKGASKGEGLGNKFLGNIREVDAIIEVVRCFEDDDIIHNMGSIDPIRDIEIIATELILADLQSIEKQLERNEKKAKGQDKDAIANIALLKGLQSHLNEGHSANTFPNSSPDDRIRIKQFFLLTSKPVVFACNVSEDDLADLEGNVLLARVREYAAKHREAGCVAICSKLEEDLGELPAEEAKEYMDAVGLSDSGVSEMLTEVFALLGLSSFFTENEKEVHAWAFRRGTKAPQCAGLVHTDFERGFINAEVVAYKDLAAFGDFHKAREGGKYRTEGKDYEVRDGDIVRFRFNL